MTRNYLVRAAKKEKAALARIKEALEDAGVVVVKRWRFDEMTESVIGDGDMLLSLDDDGQVVARFDYEAAW
jgi:hypothetical protein